MPAPPEPPACYHFRMMLNERHAAPAKARRFLYLLEPLSFAVFVSWYIWRLQTAVPESWGVFPAWLIVSFVAHRDTPKTLGWRADNLFIAMRKAAPAFLAFTAALFVGGLLLGGLHRFPARLLDAHHFWGYCAFCLLQQVALNSFLSNRFLAAFQNPLTAALASGLVFAALHWPNPVLVPLTFIGGASMAWLFAEQRNILPLTLGQAVLGALVWWAFPLAWHHGMRVGPGYYAFHQYYGAM